MRRAPVVSLYSQPPLLNPPPFRSGLSLWQRTSGNLPRAPGTFEWLTSAIISAHPKAPAPPESTPSHSTTSLDAHAQSRTTCLAPSHPSPDQDSDYASSTTIGARARRKQAPSHRVGRQRQRRGFWSPYLYSQTPSAYPLRTPTRPLLDRLLFSTFPAYHTITAFSCAPVGHAFGARTSRAHRS